MARDSPLYSLTFNDLVRALRMAEPKGRADNAALQGEICTVLWHMSSLNEKNRRQAGMAGAVEAVTGAMAGRPQNMALQEQACKALGGLLLDDGENQSKAGQAGTADALVAVLRAGSDVHGTANTVHSVLEPALWAMRQFVAHHGENRKRAGEAGAVEEVIQAMRSNAACPIIQGSACGTLQSLVLNERVNQDRALEAGAVDATVAAMRAHVRSVEVQDHGCGALQNMAFDHHPARVKAGEAGAMEAVVAAMQCYKDSKTVQEHGCGAIWNMVTDNADNFERAKSAKALEAVVGAIQTFPGTEAVQDHACGALAILDPPGARGATAATAIEHGHLGSGEMLLSRTAPISGDTLHHFFRYTPPRKGFHTLADAQVGCLAFTLHAPAARRVPAALHSRPRVPALGATARFSRQLRRALLTCL